MGFKYEQEDIWNVIATAILENENKLNRIHYKEIHRRVKRIIVHSISDTKLLKTLSDMIHEGELIKYDPTQGKRGSKVFYTLTDKAKEKYRLRILGTDEK